MEDRIRQRYSDDVLQQMMARYEIPTDGIHLLDGFESFIYEFIMGERSYILRIAHTLRRSINLIQGEVDWINFLSAGGASVARAVPSTKGNLVEMVADDSGGHFLGTAFEKASGKPPGKELLKADLFVRYGQLLGRMHALSRQYHPASEARRRLEWNDPEMLYAETWLGSEDRIALEKYWVLREYLENLPMDEDSYGLIHQDAHYGNLFVDEGGRITLFDFDDCCYSWYMNDIAIVLFYAVLGQENGPLFTREFMTHFLHGYRQENDLNPEWLKEIPSFLKLREIDLYAVIHRSFDVENLEDPWVAYYMRGRKQRIEENIPFADYNFEELGDA